MILTSIEACESNNFNARFPFINKHARNYDKRAKNEATSVASHAASVYYHRKKKETASQGTPIAVSRGGRLSSNSREAISRESSREPSEPTILLWDSGIAAKPAAKTGRRSTIRSRKQHGDSRPSPAASSNNMPLPLKTICLGSPDPFETFPCRLDPKKAALTQIWHRYFMNLCLPAGGSHKLEAVANRAWQSRVFDMMQDPMQASAFFAGALAIKARFLAPETAKETWPEVYQLHTDALAALRERLQSKSYSEGVLLTMFTVGSVNFYSGDWADNLKHYYAADQITHLLGGINALSETTRDHMVEGCLNTAFCLMTRPHLRYQRWITGPWTSHPLSGKRPCVADVPFGNSAWSLSDNQESSTDRLESHFRAYREVVGVCRIAQSLGPDQVEDKDDICFWLHRRRRTLRVQCLDYWCDLEDLIGDTSQMDQRANLQADEQLLQDRLHQALVLGADCFDAMYIHHQKCHAHSLPMWLIYLPIPQLRKALHTVLETMTGQGSFSHPKALLWLFFVGACAEEIARKMGATFWSDDLGLNCRDWFVDVSERLGLGSPDQTRKILKEYLYEDKFGDGYLQALLKK